MVAAALRSVFTQQGAAAVEDQSDQGAAMLTGKLPRAAELMATAREDELTHCFGEAFGYRHFPASHRRKLRSTKLL